MKGFSSQQWSTNNVKTQVVQEDKTKIIIFPV